MLRLNAEQALAHSWIQHFPDTCDSPVDLRLLRETANRSKEFSKSSAVLSAKEEEELDMLEESWKKELDE